MVNFLWFLKTSVKESHDHLKCRQPTSLTMYVMDNLAKVIETLKNGDSMQAAIIPLESYKCVANHSSNIQLRPLNGLTFLVYSISRALYGNHWENIWDAQPDRLSTASDYQLQLTRWFSLYKSNICTEKETQDQLVNKCNLLRPLICCIIWSCLNHIACFSVLLCCWYCWISGIIQ